MTLFERFAQHVHITDTCWLWEGSCFENGYGYFDNRKAHRISYELFVGPFPLGLVSDHLCRVRHCVNPWHIEPVTQRENAWRGNLSLIYGWGQCPHGFDRKRDCYDCREVYRQRYEQKYARQSTRRYAVVETELTSLTREGTMNTTRLQVGDKVIDWAGRIGTVVRVTLVQVPLPYRRLHVITETAAVIETEAAEDSYRKDGAQ